MTHHAKNSDICSICYAKEIERVVSSTGPDHELRQDLSEWVDESTTPPAAPAAAAAPIEEGSKGAGTTVETLGKQLGNSRRRSKKRQKKRPNRASREETQQRKKHARPHSEEPAAKQSGSAPSGSEGTASGSEDTAGGPAATGPTLPLLSSLGGDASSAELRLVIALPTASGLGLALEDGVSSTPGNSVAQAAATEQAPQATLSKNWKEGACQCQVGADKAKCSEQNPTAAAVACDVCQQWVCSSCYAGKGQVPQVFDGVEQDHALFVCNNADSQCTVEFHDFPFYNESSGAWVARTTFTCLPHHDDSREGRAPTTATTELLGAARIDPYSTAPVDGFEKKHGKKVGCAVASVHKRARARKRKFEESVLHQAESSRNPKRSRSKDAQGAKGDRAEANDGAEANEAEAIMAEVVASLKAQVAAASKRLLEITTQAGQK
jgi:hypothetical protein